MDSQCVRGGALQEKLEILLFSRLSYLQGALVIKNPSANAGDIKSQGSIRGSGRSRGGGHSNTLHYSCLENPTDRGACRAAVHGMSKSQTRLKLLSTHAHHCILILHYGVRESDRCWGLRGNQRKQSHWERQKSDKQTNQTIIRSGAMIRRNNILSAWEEHAEHIKVKRLPPRHASTYDPNHWRGWNLRVVPPRGVCAKVLRKRSMWWVWGSQRSGRSALSEEVGQERWGWTDLGIIELLRALWPLGGFRFHFKAI